jgi:hypothetical protein
MVPWKQGIYHTPQQVIIITKILLPGMNENSICCAIKVLEFDVSMFEYIRNSI